MITLELNKIFHIIITSSNLLICFIIISTFYSVSKKPYRISRDLRIYFAFCLEPYGFLVIVCSVITGIHWFIFADVESLIYKIFRMILVFSAMQIRYSYLLIVLSRIIATIFYKHYSKYSSSTRSVAITIIATHAASILNGYIEFIRVFVDMNQYFFAAYIGLLQHLITLILCKILHDINKKKYKSIAYQSSLSERHQIYKNVKLLKSIWPMILIFSTISPLGPLSVIAYRNLFEIAGPSAFYYLFYNLAFLIIIFWKLSLSSNENLQHINIIGRKNVVVHPATAAMAKFGRGEKIQPQIISVEKYFNNLEKQWK